MYSTNIIQKYSKNVKRLLWKQKAFPLIQQICSRQLWRNLKDKTYLSMKIQYLLNKIESIVENEEIAHYEQFLLLPQWFQNSSAAEAWESCQEGA